MKVLSLTEELKSNSYPGRGIVIGRSADGKTAVTAYFIMGRSENSRNRVFVEDGEGIRTQAFDPAKLEDPSLIIYAPVRVLGNKTIVTNGDQTDTIYQGMDKQLTFEQSLRCREFEPDGPNYTPRISGIMHIENGSYNYAMSILKSSDGDPKSCCCHKTAYPDQSRQPGFLSFKAFQSILFGNHTSPFCEFSKTHDLFAVSFFKCAFAACFINVSHFVSLHFLFAIL